MNEEDKEYWQQLNKAYIESSSQFDKQLLFFASGAFGLSFAFIKDIVKLDIASHKYILVSSWVLFSGVILVSIVSHYTSLKAINTKIKNIHYKEDKGSKTLDGYTKWFNISMIFMLALGLILLTVFIAINI